MSNPLASSVVVASGLCLALGSHAQASIAEINPAYAVTTAGPSAGLARFRVSHTNWDQGLVRGTTPSNSMPTNNVVGFGSSVPNSAGREYQMTVQNIPGEGLIYRLDDLTTSLADDFVVSWGTFSVSPGGSNRATIDGGTPFDTYYNTIHVFARAQNRASSGAPAQDNRVAWRDITFTSPLSATGSFFDGEIDAIPVPNTDTSNDLANIAVEQWVVTTTDLRTIPWTVSAKVTLDSDQLIGGVQDPPGSGEGLQFEIGLKNAVPTPGSASALVFVAVAVAGRRRR
jgi:hypothetical protein